MTLLTPAQVSAIYATRKGGEVKCLFWIEALNRSTDTVEGIGGWQGLHNQSFDVDGETRAYGGLGANLDCGMFEYEIGLVVKNHTVRINGAAQQARELVRNYNMKYRKVEIHQAHFDPQTGELFGINRAFRGYADEAPESIGKNSGPITLSLSLVSGTRDLTKTPNAMKSHASQNAINGDLFYRDIPLIDKVNDPWVPK